MSYDNAINELRSKFELLDIIDLSSYDKNLLRSALRKYNNFEFSPEQRLVFIADSKLTRSFNDLPPDILVRLQQDIQYLNIAHYFIVVVSDIPTIERELDFLYRKYYSQETMAMPFVLVE
jgi:hypothetical protein